MPSLSPNLGCPFPPGMAGDKAVLVDLHDEAAPAEWSVAALEAEFDAVARGLLRRGLQQGDRVGILSLNRVAFLATFFGAMRAGLVAVPISFKLPRAALDHVMADAALRLVFHDRERAALVPQGVPGIGFDDDGPEGYAAFRDPGPFAAVRPSPREAAMMLYTSGSTGKPKGVVLAHESQRWPIDRALAAQGDLSGHTYIVAAPLFHMNATFNAKMAFAAGARLVLLPAFDARRYARAIERYRVTTLTSVPTMLALVAREGALLGALDLRSVARVQMGSAPLTQALIEKVRAVFPAAAITNSYGTTEAGPSPFGAHPGDVPRPPLSLGYPYAGSECELREGPSRDEGVLYLRSPMLMEGYHNLPGKTAEVMRDGWYRSGDIMRRDANGFYYFLGRADDMFVVGGENVWPGEVERLLETMPGVHQAAVVPVADEIKGTLPFAFLVARDGASIDETAVKTFSIAQGPAYAHPRFVEFIAAIPLAATNKPDRRLLIEMAEATVARRRGG